MFFQCDMRDLWQIVKIGANYLFNSLLRRISFLSIFLNIGTRREQDYSLTLNFKNFVKCFEEGVKRGSFTQFGDDGITKEINI